jgi:hypothetical protein
MSYEYSEDALVETATPGFMEVFLQTVSESIAR